MKIILLDTINKGHHTQFINIIINYCISFNDELHFITWHYNKDIERIKNKDIINIHYICNNSHNKFKMSFGKRGCYYLYALNKTIKLAKQINADVIQLMYIDRNEKAILLRLPFRILKKKPKIYGLLISPELVENAHKKSSHPNILSFDKWLRKLSVYYLAKFNILSKIYVLSDETKQKILNQVSNKLNYKIKVLPDPLEEIHFEHNQVEARHILALPEEGKIFLFFGKMTKEKGIDILINASLQLTGNFYVVLAGEPDYINLENSIRIAIKNNNKFILHDYFIPDNLLAYYFIGSDAVVLPYRSSYLGTSGILQWAVSAYKPCIASKTGEIHKIVNKWDLGITFEPENVNNLQNVMQMFIDGFYNKHINVYNFKNYISYHKASNMPKIMRDDYTNNL